MVSFGQDPRDEILRSALGRKYKHSVPDKHTGYTFLGWVVWRWKFPHQLDTARWMICTGPWHCEPTQLE